MGLSLRWGSLPMGKEVVSAHPILIERLWNVSESKSGGDSAVERMLLAQRF